MVGENILSSVNEMLLMLYSLLSMVNVTMM